ncbi:MAG: BON domain-containing protein [Streptomyces sp.]|jgi:BON domain|uniref:BON domain-containing protein n=1 Tax=Streptomyces sp. TaxID=1931 RepID=UPI0025EBC41C|nr:BON domain-containing protein [Streptomyces sp.]MBW8798468.1 BON domain-containing protein [Streptomyces sp.]
MNLEYLVAHVAEHLAAGPCGELGVRAEIRGGTVLLTGTVPSAACRDAVSRVVQDELAGVPVHCDLVVAETAPPDHPEVLT